MFSESLSKIQALSRLAFPFNRERYPGFDRLNPEERRNFALRHVALHVGKAQGALMGVVEALDHGGELNIEALTVALRKLLVDTIQTAGIAGISAETLLLAIEDWAAQEMKGWDSA